MDDDRTRTRSRLGFTLVELLIAVVLIGVLTAVALPRFPVAALRADAGARSWHGALRLAQRLAITRQADVVVLLDAEGSRLRVFEDFNRNGQIDGDERARAFPIEEGVELAPPPVGGVFNTATEAVSGTNLQLREGVPSVVFRRNGTASSDVELYLRSRRGATEAWRAIVVAPSTGRSEAWRLVNATWTRMQP
jgi:prepilin-type N-terminal cleavage/methylation domain-containing protein